MGILDFLFPKCCVACRAFGSYLCEACKIKIKPVEGMICPMCERAGIDGKTHPGCQTRYSLDRLISFFRYDGPVKDAIKRLKYKPYLSELADLLVAQISYDNSAIQQLNNDFLVVPVPLHPKRERERGFNQASLIGQEIAARLNLEFRSNLLKRVRNTRPQTELKEKERRENIKNAFAVSSNYTLSPKPYTLLIDDIWTTGSTLRAAGNVLKREGAKKVWAMTIAR